MPSKRKRKSGGETRGSHPRNKYSDNPPDFCSLASLYPSFQPYVFYSREGKPKIDWTDFNATRELTRVLLLHDHGLDWWIPDGQLCPTVPNRSNYIHWIEDLLASNLVSGTRVDGRVNGFDIGTGANCIYPLLGASLLGWKFVGSDVTDVAIEWANRNVMNNPHITELIEIRRVECEDDIFDVEELQTKKQHSGECDLNSHDEKALEIVPAPSSVVGKKKGYCGSHVLLGVVKDGENFDFCMCNPPFFETMEEAGLNPNTACGGTSEEMVCIGGERAFISHIIGDSVQLKHRFRWFTSMVGRKSNLSMLVAELWDNGVTVVKTTEFVQGKTSRWGLAWSFLPASRMTISSQGIEKNNQSFMLEGLQRQYSAFHVLQSIESFLSCSGATCKVDAAAFRIDTTATREQCDAILKTGKGDKKGDHGFHHELETHNPSDDHHIQSDVLRFRISVFQQIPGTLLVRGSLHERESSNSGVFSLIFQHLEQVLRNKFCYERTLSDGSCSKNRR
ncbi:uncharacterized protein LOC142547093 isoform X1 [Primulina tabacum]|uniref:uncharacterized protein LOC142547093 isoform X1 n=1 Tax=Primulina tabacum TaxID=48773 RepID=UPI003F5AD8BB